MDEAEFDKFADEYRAIHAHNIRLSGEAPEFFAEYKVRDLADAVRGRSVSRKHNLDMLDFGGGVGASVPHFRQYFPNGRLTCLDVSRKSLALAADRFPNAAEFVHFDGTSIPFDEGSFDVAFAACVFHHIDHEQHSTFFREIHRVLRSTGVFFVFEHNPLNPLTVRAVRSCEFDENAHMIGGREMRNGIREAGFTHVRLKYRVFFPHPLAALRPLEKYLGLIPLGAQYHVVAEKL